MIFALGDSGFASMAEAEGARATSYCNVVASDQSGASGSRLPFEPLPQLKNQIYQEELNKWKTMEVDVESSHPKVTVWEPGKYIPQVSMAPRYVVSSIRVSEQTKYMKDHALIDKFLGLWPSEWDLIKWINTWWKPRAILTFN